ncbi:MAG: dienelactone hydrolase family protein [Verrucomicrobiota bacterium]|nr:dienelactone hydrolase family protein [Verrucomicrobiota bacterium]
MKTLITLSLLFICVISAHAKSNSFILNYKIDGQEFEGYVAVPAGLKGKAPGVMVVHDWMGLSDFTKKRADELAREGYVAFAVDVYGKGKRASTPEEAMKLAGPFKKNVKLLRKNMLGAYNQFIKLSQVDKNKVAATGFCFGGTAVLELARTGADIKGAASFHGVLQTTNPNDGKNVKCKLLILHGNLDPYVPPAQVAGFMEEMNKAQVWYRFVGYPDTVHAFTSPAAGTDITKGAAYNPTAARQSYHELQKFLKLVLKK